MMLKGTLENGDIWYAIFGLAVNIAMLVIPLAMLLDLRKRNKGDR